MYIKQTKTCLNNNSCLLYLSANKILPSDKTSMCLIHGSLSSGGILNVWYKVQQTSLKTFMLRPVTFVTIDTLKMISKIQIHDDCRGIACINNKLIVNCVTNGLKVLTLNGKTLKVFPQFVGYMSLLQGPNESLLCSHFASDRVVCMDLKGKVIYDFNDQTYLCSSLQMLKCTIFFQQNRIL
jgi:hypothetical protein